jgi:copper transporter 1
MLLGMYYNGYILFAIFIGHTIGFIVFARDTCVLSGHTNASGNCC